MPRMGTKSLLKSNIEFWMNDKFLREGLYTNISTGDVDLYGNDISRLEPITADPKFIDGTVYQSAFKNWVYEPGISSSVSGIASPIIASGITIDGTFYPEATTSGAFEHFIDFPNGRVVFLSPLIGASLLQASFAYKTVNIESASKFNNENRELLIETAYKDNPAQTGIQIYPNESNRTLPAVWLDFQSRDSLPYELGTKAPIKEYLGVFHIWTRNEFDLDMIEDILADAQRDVILGVDFNDAPFPLLSRGRRNTSWPGYASQAQVWTPFFWRKIYLDSTKPTQITPLFEVERSEVRFNIKVYPNF